MSAHSHHHGPWPFEAPQNTAAICCSHVLLRERPILFVTHDRDDGGWQLLCGESHETSEGRVACLGCMVSRDAALLELADMPKGWAADRAHVGAEWNREPHETPDE